MPIYLVIYERDTGPQGYQYDGAILAVISCDLADRDAIYGEIVNPLSYAGRFIYTHTYRREPDSPLREQAQTLDEYKKSSAWE